jgi:hypothetical protein
MTFLRTASVDPAPRHDLYATIHKGLRAFMCDTLVRMGRLDADDPHALAEALEALAALLALCESHLAHENTHVHPAMEAALAGSSADAAEHHEEHLHAIAMLRRNAALLPELEGAARRKAALGLYRLLALFVGENLIHMQHEEVDHNDCLWRTHDDAELRAIEGRIVAGLAPEEMALCMRWMVPALTPSERLALLGPLAQMLPPAQFEALMGIIRPHLPAPDLARLELALRRAA